MECARCSQKVFTRLAIDRMTSGRDLPCNIFRFDRDGQAVASLQVNKLGPGALL